MNLKWNHKNRSVFEGSAIKTEVIKEDKKMGGTAWQKSQIEVVNTCSFPHAALNRGGVNPNANSWLFCKELDMLHNSVSLHTDQITASD